MEPKKNLKAVILARVSSKEQEETGYSLPAQTKLLKEYAERTKLKLAHDPFEISESASKFDQRDVFKLMMDFVNENDIPNIVVEKVDRHVRNLQDAVDTDDWLRQKPERKLHFVKDALVLHTNSRSQEWLNWGIRVVIAKNYIDNLREESAKGVKEKLEQGWYPASIPPIGYKHSGDKGHKT